MQIFSNVHFTHIKFAVNRLFANCFGCGTMLLLMCVSMAKKKVTEKGRDAMCESFTKLADKVADERAEQTPINIIKLMMKNMKCSLEDALNVLEIKGKERAIIAKQLQK